MLTSKEEAKARALACLADDILRKGQQVYLRSDRITLHRLCVLHDSVDAVQVFLRGGKTTPAHGGLSVLGNGTVAWFESGAWEQDLRDWHASVSAPNAADLPAHQSPPPATALAHLTATIAELKATLALVRLEHCAMRGTMEVCYGLSRHSIHADRALKDIAATLHAWAQRFAWER